MDLKPCGPVIDAKAVGIALPPWLDLVLIGRTQGWLGQSLWLREMAGREDGAPPPVDPAGVAETLAVLHAARTCRAFSNPQYLIADAVQKRLGIPVAMIEGDMVDESFYKDELVNARLEAMMEAIEGKKRMIIPHAA